MVCLPLRVVGRTVGVDRPVVPRPARLRRRPSSEFLGIIADTCAQALERIRALSRRRPTQTARLRFLADASIELASSLDYEATLAKVARLAVPTFADWCAIDVVEDGPAAPAGGRARRPGQGASWRASSNAATPPTGTPRAAPGRSCAPGRAC